MIALVHPRHSRFRSRLLPLRIGLFTNGNHKVPVLWSTLDLLLWQHEHLDSLDLCDETVPRCYHHGSRQHIAQMAKTLR